MLRLIRDGAKAPTYQEAAALKVRLEARVDELIGKLNRFPRSGPFRLTPDAVKSSPDFRATKSAFDVAFADLRALNGLMAKLFRSEMAADNAARREAFQQDRALRAIGAMAKAEGR
jgi:hypothetical protein